ncbi:glycosyltransferase [Priestia megaterium]|uniref:glycosyltransferase n=1 Tax=Priestia megaterium TaxID=1404 RepID=UPI00234F6AEF|nr:glycosyltransferase [Priestia megaterium]MDC7783892.1 glycosyltransferase [Priestia megaterium]
MKKKILHILSSNKYSGAENIATCIITNLSKQYESAYVSPNGPIKDALEERGVTYFPIESNSISNIKKVVKDWKPDIIHAHDFGATIKSSLASSNIPIVSHIHQNPTWLKKLNLRSLIFFMSCFRISHIVAVTPAIVDSAVFASFFKNKVSVIENTVDTKLVIEKSRVCCNEHYDLAFIGRLVDVKDPLRFINIVDNLVKKNPTTKAVIIGDGLLEDKCLEAIKDKNLEKNIFLKGYMSNPYPILSNSKTLVMTSKSEGLPMTVIEALVLGKPVIVPQIEGIEKVVDKTCGLICKNDDEYVNGLTKILEDNEVYQNMSKKAKLKAEYMFDMKRYCQKFIEVYNNVL